MSYHRKLSGEYEYAYFMDSQIYKVNVIDESYSNFLMMNRLMMK